MIPFYMGPAPSEKTPDQAIELIERSDPEDWVKADDELCFVLKSDITISLKRYEADPDTWLDHVFVNYQAIGWINLDLPLKEALQTIEPFDMTIVRV